MEERRVVWGMEGGGAVVVRRQAVKQTRTSDHQDRSKHSVEDAQDSPQEDLDIDGEMCLGIAEDDVGTNGVMTSVAIGSDWGEGSIRVDVGGSTSLIRVSLSNTSLGGGVDTSTPKRLRTLDEDSVSKHHRLRLDMSSQDRSPVVRTHTHTQTFTYPLDWETDLRLENSDQTNLDKSSFKFRSQTPKRLHFNTQTNCLRE